MPVNTKNFTEAFRDERDIYVQNVANAQVSIEFQLSNNRVEGFTFPNNRDPINLSQNIPFDAIKNSMDFRKMLTRRPAALIMLTDDEFTAYFKSRAKRDGLVDSEGEPDAEAAMDVAEERRRRLADKNMRENVATSDPKPIHTVTETGSGPGGAKRFGEKERVSHEDEVSEEEVITPKILHLCNQVKSEVPEEERMPARALLEELNSINGITIDDCEHIRAHGYYKSVKKWAKKEIERLVSESEANDEGAED